MTLLGTWTTLVPNKLVEARKLDGTNRRLIALAAGLLVGGVGLVLARILRLDLSPQHEFFDNPRYLGPVYFGASVHDHGGMVIARGPRPDGAVPHHAGRGHGAPGNHAHPGLALHATRRDRNRRLDRHDRSTGQPVE